MPTTCRTYDELKCLFENQSTDCELVDLGLPFIRAELIEGEFEMGPFITYHKLLKIETAAGKLMHFVTLESIPGSDRWSLCEQTATMHRRCRHFCEKWTRDTFIASARDLLDSASGVHAKVYRKQK